MEQIEWAQDNHNLAFFIIKVNDEKLRIKIEPKILGILVSHTPKIFYVDLNVENKNLKFIVDFSALKPIVAKAKKLKVKIKSHKAENISFIQPEKNFYKISRGESFMERFLGLNGWQSQEFAFPFENMQEETAEKEDAKISTKFSEINQHQNIQKTAPKTNIKTDSSKIIRKCKNCGYIINDDDDVDYCPNCFAPLFEAEEGVDFAI